MKRPAAPASEMTKRWRGGSNDIRRGTIGAMTSVDSAAAAPFSPTIKPDPVISSRRREIKGMDKPNTIPHTAAQQIAAISERLLAKAESVKKCAVDIIQL